MPNRLPYFILLGSTALWCIGFYIAPFITNAQTASLFYTAYTGVCHQLPDHSFHIHGSILAVCIRCTALYTAFLAGIIMFPLLRTYNFSFTTHRYYIILLAVPMIVDVVASWITGYSSTTISRAVSGGMFGFGAALLLVPLFLEAVHQFVSPRSKYSLFNKYGGSV